MEGSLKHKDLSKQIIGASMSVLNTLKPGLDEKVYERSLILELQTKGLKCEQQKSHPVFYRGQEVGNLIPDLIVAQSVIVDTKVVTVFNDAHIAQMIGYLNITGLDLALLINFKYSKLQWKRILRPESVLLSV